MFVAPDCAKLQYAGRIDDTNKNAPVMVYPCSFVKIRFTGKRLTIYLENHSIYWDNYMGYILDGTQYRFKLQESGRQEVVIQLPDGNEHECMLFKRMDACHLVTFYGFGLEDGSSVLTLEELPKRKMEFYGDSISAGEVSEAVDWAGREDPVHQGQYSNSWYSYAWMTARKLHASLHDIAQGGIALLDHTGWFGEPDYIGMERIYDKVVYDPQTRVSKQWDFSAYTPHVVVIAIGQNDSHPQDYMAKDPQGEKAQIWKRHYAQFISNIREKYPKAVIIAATTIMYHDARWDEAIEEVCCERNDANVHHFLYSCNGCKTPGHIRIQEAEQMAEELSTFINGLGEEIWNY